MKDFLSEIKSAWYHGRGQKYSKRGEYEKALTYYLKALKYARQGHNKGTIATELASVGMVYLKLGEIFRGRKHLSESLKLYSELSHFEDDNFFSEQVAEVKKFLKIYDPHKIGENDIESEDEGKKSQS